MGASGIGGTERRAARSSASPDGERSRAAKLGGTGAGRRGLDEAVRRSSRGRRRLVLGCGRRGVRVPRSERRRQDNDGAHACHRDLADVRLRRDRGRAARTGTRCRDSSAHRRDAGEPRPLPAADGGRESRVLRRPVRPARPAATDPAGSRSGQPRKPRRRSLRHASRKGCASGSGWPGRSSAIPRSSSSTSRPPGSTRWQAGRCTT